MKLPMVFAWTWSGKSRVCNGRWSSLMVAVLLREEEVVSIH